MESELIAPVINGCVILLLIFTFIYIIWDRFISDVTLYDLMKLPASDPSQLSYFIEPSQLDDTPVPLPSIFDPPAVYFSLIIPVRNEASRLLTILNDAVRYFTIRQTHEKSFSWEIIVVDDGSADGTPNIVHDFGRQNQNVRLLRHSKVIGKGAAVQTGALHARGN
jgi:dolichyl-phosphate beta-glucosyltransferase